MRVVATAIVLAVMLAGGAARAQSSPSPTLPKVPAAAGGQSLGSDDAAGGRPVREGFTIEIDGGFGVTRTAGTIDGITTRPAVGGLDVGLGAFVTPELALLFRFSAQTFYIAEPDDTNQISAHAFAGPAIQLWLDDRFFVGAGAGLGVEGGQRQDGSMPDSAIGLGVTARGGYAVSVNEDAAWRVSIETSYALLEGRRAYSGALLIGWQSF